MSPNTVVPETRVLAIASHVVYGYVGNTMATLVMQTLGCDVAALNTIYRALTENIAGNHTGYRQWKGTKTSAEEIRDLYTGLKQSYLTDFDVLLTGYIPSAEAVNAVGSIARDLKLKGSMKAGSFFWILDPVMGDEGKLYISEDVVPAYRNLLRDADLILPNQFEAETLSETKITSLPTLKEAITKLHKTYRVPHIIVTSVSLPDKPATMSVIGSTATSDFSPRMFKIDVPAIACFFSGTGDMFAALTVVRFREAITNAKLKGIKSWVSPDDVEASDLPLAKAAEKVLGSMHTVLSKTKEARDQELEGMAEVMEKEKDSEKRILLRKTKAAEVKVVRCLEDLREPKLDWKAVAFDENEGGGAIEYISESKNDQPASAGEREGLGMQHLARAGKKLESGHAKKDSVDSTLPHRRA